MSPRIVQLLIFLCLLDDQQGSKRSHSILLYLLQIYCCAFQWNLIRDIRIASIAGLHQNFLAIPQWSLWKHHTYIRNHTLLSDELVKEEIYNPLNIISNRKKISISTEIIERNNIIWILRDNFVWLPRYPIRLPAGFYDEKMNLRKIWLVSIISWLKFNNLVLALCFIRFILNPIIIFICLFPTKTLSWRIIIIIFELE